MADNRVLPIGLKAVFTFLPPFDEKYSNKEYEVAEIRKLKAIVDSEGFPFENIYQPLAMTKDDYVDDLNENIPIVTLTQDNETYLYVPMDRIKEIPPFVGRTATELLITFSLGVVPDDVNITPLVDNIRMMVNDTLNLQPEVIATPGGPTVLMSDEDYERYIRMMKGKQRSYNKSFRVMYLEEVERNRVMREEKEEIERFVGDILSR